MRGAIAFLLFGGVVWALVAHAPGRPGNHDFLTCRVDAEQVVFNRSRGGRVMWSYGVDDTHLRVRTRASQDIRRERITEKSIGYDRILDDEVTRVRLRVNDHTIAWVETIPRDCWDCLVAPGTCEQPEVAAT